MLPSRLSGEQTDPMSVREDAGPTPDSTQWVKDPAWLWLWWRPAAAAPIRPLAWEPPRAAVQCQVPQHFWGAHKSVLMYFIIKRK